jgi:hypothetical protein
MHFVTSHSVRVRKLKVWRVSLFNGKRFFFRHLKIQNIPLRITSTRRWRKQRNECHKFNLVEAYWFRVPTGLTLKNYIFCPHLIYLFCIYLRTNSDLCHLQHKLTGFYNRDEKCLQRGTNWVFKHSTLRFVCKGLIFGEYFYRD